MAKMPCKNDPLREGGLQPEGKEEIISSCGGNRKGEKKQSRRTLIPQTRILKGILGQNDGRI